MKVTVNPKVQFDCLKNIKLSILEIPDCKTEVGSDKMPGNLQHFFPDELGVLKVKTTSKKDVLQV